MNKLTTLALAGLVAVSASAVASDSRLAGFGASSAFIADVQDIWTLPAVVASNKNATYFEMGEYTGFGGEWCCPSQNDPNDNTKWQGQAWGGVHAEVGPGVLGVWVNRPTTLELEGLMDRATNQISTSFSEDEFGNPETAWWGYGAEGRVDLFYAFGLGEQVDLGIHVSRINNDSKVEYKDSWGAGWDQTSTLGINGLGFGIGADIKEVAIFKLLQVGLDIDTIGLTYTELVVNDQPETKYTQGANTVKFRVGADVAGDEGKFGRLEVGLGMGAANAKNDAYGSGVLVDGNKEYKAGAMLWNLGYAIGKSSDKGMGLAGLMLEGYSASQEWDAANTKSEEGSLTLALSTAGEAKVKEWLTARAGLSANLLEMDSQKYPSGDPTKNDTENYSNNGSATISTGLSLNFGDLTIDGVLNQDLLYTGTYLISGLQETLFSKVSATWGW